MRPPLTGLAPPKIECETPVPNPGAQLARPSSAISIAHPRDTQISKPLTGGSGFRAQQVLVDAGHLAPRPAALSPVIAGGLPVAASPRCRC